MDHLRRDLAPISNAAWAEIDGEAVRTLKHQLAARSLIDFTGPHGWSHAAGPTGRIEPATPARVEGVEGFVRGVRPLFELRTPFELSRAELDAIDRGAADPDLDPLIDAARNAALAEDRTLFHGYEAVGVQGISPASPHDALRLTDDFNQYPGVVARAVAVLRQAGVGGPYAIALGPRCYTGVIETTEHGGYPVLEHVRLILGGPVVWAPAVDGAIVISQRGGDYEMVCGQDLSIGYLSHTDTTVRLYIEESFTLVVRDPRAAVALEYSD